MAVIARGSELHKAFADQVLLLAERIELDDQTCVGLIGRNGAGKSTLLRCLLGQERFDSGEYWLDPDARLGWLRQDDPFAPEESIVGFLQRDSGQPDWRCAEAAARFGFAGDRLDEPIAGLAGGWRTRLKLVALLLSEPRVLLLDEPTNFLDLRTQILLADFLSSWRSGALIVSHDRDFLRRTCRRTLALEGGRLHDHQGDVDSWLRERAEQRERLQRENQAIAAKRKQLETFIVQNRANPNTAPQARSKAKQLERLVLHEIPDELPSVRILLPQVERRSGPALHVDELAIGYDGVAVAEGIRLSIDRGERYAVLGDNGQGKTTLIRTLAGDLPPVAGDLRWTHGADLGVYAQHVFESLPDSGRVCDYLSARAPEGAGNQLVRDVAGTFRFGAQHFEKDLGVLSGGERARLVLAGLLLGRHTVLLLDEPTNHLDVDSIDALAEALTSYGGTLLLVSHDRAFVSRVCTGVLDVGDGRVRHWTGDVAAWVAEAEGQLRPATAKKPLHEQSAAPPSDGRRKRDAARRLKAAERQMEKWTGRRDELERSLLTCSDPKRAADLHGELQEVVDRLATAETDWLAAAEVAGLD